MGKEPKMSVQNYDQYQLDVKDIFFRDKLSTCRKKGAGDVVRHVLLARGSKL